MNIDEMFSPRDDVEMKLLTERLHSYIKRIRELRSGAQSVDSHSFFKVSIFKILCAEALGIWNYNFFVRSQTLRSLVNFLWQFGKASVMMVQPSACRITSFYKTQKWSFTVLAVYSFSRLILWRWKWKTWKACMKRKSANWGSI